MPCFASLFHSISHAFPVAVKRATLQHHFTSRISLTQPLRLLLSQALRTVENFTSSTVSNHEILRVSPETNHLGDFTTFLMPPMGPPPKSYLSSFPWRKKTKKSEISRQTTSLKGFCSSSSPRNHQRWLYELRDPKKHQIFFPRCF